jgi:hypothetical protein
MKLPPQSRYARVSRRSVLRGGVGLGATVVLAACGNQDAEILARGLPSTTAVAGGPISSVSTPPANTVTPGTVDPEPGTGPALPPGTEMVVSFTYQQLPGGKNEPPYVAVWIEDSDGSLVATVALWFQQDSRGTRWLRDLKRWFNLDQARIEAGGLDVTDIVSSATRRPGSYQVVWDGTDVDGNPLRAGDYFLAIESNREHGTYSLIRQPMTLTGEPLTLGLIDADELVAASVSVA